MLVLPKLREMRHFGPCGLGDQNSANVCHLHVEMRRLTKRYKLSYTTGLLHAWPFCMQWGVWVGTVGHWVVLVQVIYCSKGGWVLFSKNQRHTWGEILSYSHSRKPDLPVTHFSPFSMWLSVLFFFPSPLKPRCQGMVMGFVGGGGNIAITTALTPSFCVLCCKHQIVYRFFVSYFLCLPEASVSGCGD